MTQDQFINDQKRIHAIYMTVLEIDFEHLYERINAMEELAEADPIELDRFRALVHAVQGLILSVERIYGLEEETGIH